MSKPYASAIEPHEHIKVFAQIIAERMNALQVESVKNRVYLIGQVHTDALYFLAEQFDVLGYKGWFLANTEQSRRDLIRRAIELHRHMGTPWAVKESIRSLGFNDVILIERVGLYSGFYDGSFNYSGGSDYGGADSGSWATFTVIIDLANWTEYLSGPYITALLGMIDTYKNVRSHLVELILQLNFEDSLSFVDGSDLGNDFEFIDSLNFGLQYGGSAYYDGAFGYDETGDSLVIEQTTTEYDMIFDIDAPSNGFEFYINDIVGSGTIDWGDGSGLETISGATSHVYTTAGVYNVTITSEDMTTFDISGNAVGTPITISNPLSSLTTLKLSLTPMATLTTLSDLTNLQVLHANGCGISEACPDLPSAVDIRLHNNTITASHVIETLQTFDANGLLNGQLWLQGQTPSSPPAGPGVTSKNSLIAKGWTVFTD